MKYVFYNNGRLPAGASREPSQSNVVKLVLCSSSVKKGSWKQFCRLRHYSSDLIGGFVCLRTFLLMDPSESGWCPTRPLLVASMNFFFTSVCVLCKMCTISYAFFPPFYKTSRIVINVVSICINFHSSTSNNQYTLPHSPNSMPCQLQ